MKVRFSVKFHATSISKVSCYSHITSKVTSVRKKDDVDKSTNFTFLSIQSFWFDDFLRNQSEIVVKLFFESKSVNPSVFFSICGFLDGIEFP